MEETESTKNNKISKKSTIIILFLAITVLALTIYGFAKVIKI